MGSAPSPGEAGSPVAIGIDLGGTKMLVGVVAGGPEGTPQGRGGELRPLRRRGPRHDGSRAPGGTRGASRSRRRGTRHPLHDRPGARPCDQRREPADRRRSDQGPHVRATRHPRPAGQRRQHGGAGRTPLGRRARGPQRRPAHDRHRDRGRPDHRPEGLSRVDGRGRRARPHGHRHRRAALSGELSQQRLRRGRRVGHRARKGGASGSGAPPGVGPGEDPGGRRGGERPRRDGSGDRGRRGRAPSVRTDWPSAGRLRERPRERVRARRHRLRRRRHGRGRDPPGADPGGGRAPFAATDEPDSHSPRRARPRSRHDRRRNHGNG